MIRRTRLLDRTRQDRDATLFLVAVEGERTEPEYLRALEERNLVPRHRVKIHVLPPTDGASAPVHVLGAAEDAASQVLLRRDDEVWLVFDVDARSGSGRERQVIQVSEDAARRGWNVAVSNPCFELWFLLHVRDDAAGVTEQCQSVRSQLREMLGGYAKHQLPEACLDTAAIQRAIATARSLDRDPDAPCPALPSTRVYRLVDRLMHARATA